MMLANELESLGILWILISTKVRSSPLLLRQTNMVFIKSFKFAHSTHLFLHSFSVNYESDVFHINKHKMPLWSLWASFHSQKYPIKPVPAQAWSIFNPCTSGETYSVLITVFIEASSCYRSASYYSSAGETIAQDVLNQTLMFQHLWHFQSSRMHIVQSSVF